MKLRPGTLGDVETFARLINSYHTTLRGEQLWEQDELAAELLTPVNEPVTSDRYIEVEGDAVAAIHTNCPPPYALAKLYLAAPFLPDRLEHSRTLLNSGLRLVRAKPEIRSDARVQIAIPSEDPELIRLIRDLGFAVSQRVYSLEASTQNRAEPHWPEGLDVATLNTDSKQDMADAVAVFDAAFPPGSGGWRMERSEFEHMLYRDPTAIPGLSLLVRDASGPVGLATNFRDTTRELTGNVVHLGVVPRARHRGIGKALLEESFRRFHGRGWLHARLATYTSPRRNQLGLFESVGMRALFHSEVLERAAF
jgi:GNAT superfamily N-acetyltransferase